MTDKENNKYDELVAYTEQINRLNDDLINSLRDNKYQLSVMEQHNIVSMTDTEGQITYVNERFCEISGYSRAELLGQNHRIIKSGRHPDSFYKNMWDTFSSGEVWQDIICNRNKEAAEYWLETTIVPYLDDKGKPYKYISASTDITLFRQNEQRLQLSQKFADIGTWDWDLKTDGVYWSEAIGPLFGYDKEISEISYKKFVDAIHLDDRNRVSSAITDFIKKGIEYNIEHRIVWPDGQVRWVHEKGDVTRDETGQPVHMLGVVMDIHERKQAEEAKRESEEKYQRLFELSEDPMWMIHNGAFIMANQAAVKVLGYESAEELYGVHPSLISPEYQPDGQRSDKKANEMIAIAFEEGYHRYEWNHKNTSGVEFPTEISLTAVPFHGKDALFCAATDISLRKKTEAALEENRQQLLEAQSMAKIGNWQADLRNNELLCSDETFRIFGYEPGSFKPKREDFLRAVHPDDLAYVEEAEQRAVHSGVHEIEYRIIRADGTVCHVLELAQGETNLKGELVRISGTVQDISERVAMENKLAQQRKLLDMLHDATTNFVMKQDFHGAMKDMLKTLLELTESEFGFTGEVFYDENNSPYLKTHALSNIAWDQKTATLYNELENKGFEFHNLNTLFGHVLSSGKAVISNDPATDPRSGGLPEGHPVMHAFMGVPILYGEKLIGMYGIANRENGYDEELREFLRPFDTTYGVMINSRRMIEKDEYNRAELVKAKVEAETANLAKSKFLSSMSHELRTPMNAIIGFSQLLKMEMDHSLSESQRGSVDEISKAGEHLLELINEVLDLAKIESGRIELTIEPVKLNELISESLKLIMPLAQKRNINISFDQSNTGSQQLDVYADQVRLRQVMLNLLSNAVKYNCNNGMISIVCEQPDEQYIRINITDTGAGLTSEEQSQLFKAFSRIGDRQEEIEGTGIGLVITKNIVELMSGHIGVESQPGKGSTFWVELPAARSNIGHKKNAQEERSSEQKQQSIKSEYEHTVLYIEDNPANLRLITQLLKRNTSIQVLSAHEPALGLELAMQYKPDLILLDINLPVMSGFEVLKELRQCDVTRNIQVIAISVNATPRDIEDGLKAGFDHYFTKPVNLAKLIEVVETALAKKQ